jgi:hypothetical protein
VTLDQISLVTFAASFVALMTPLPAVWHEEHFWNFSVLQRVHLSNLITLKRGIIFSLHHQIIKNILSD